jgi:hypothetical protein
VLFVRITTCFALAAWQAGWAQVSVTTYHNDIARTGQNLNETILTPANVNPNGFGLLFVKPVDGYVYAQTLYVPNVSIGGQTHNVVFVATENDSVYAFDADSAAGANASPLWQVSFISPPSVTTVDSVNDIECTDLVPQIGITGTPVIDPSTGTLYVVASTKENGVFFQRLHALDIVTGNEKFGGPVAIQATVPGTGDGSSGGQIPFDALHQNQRPGLLLWNGVVYITWASHCDHPPFHGWVLGYDASNLQQVVVWNSTPNGSDGGIWQGGGGPAADSAGIYFATGNGTFDANTGGTDFGDTILKMSPPSAGTLQVLSYFAPFDQAVLFNDTDLGSGGVVLLPDLPAGSAHQHLLVQAGKQGTVYLVDRDNMGGYNSTTDQVVQELPAAIGGLYGMPAYWNNTVYFGGQTDNLKAFSFNAGGSGLLSPSAVSYSPESFVFPGPTPSISANGSSDGIVWAIETDAYASNGPAVLRAYDATNLANELYNSTQNGSRDTPGPAVKFAAATVVNGKVYVGTATQLAVFGLPLSPIIASPMQGTTLSGSLADLSWSAVTGATQYQLLVGTTPGGSDIFGGTTAGTSQLVGSIPCGDTVGGTIYVQLAADVNGYQPPVDYTYKCKSGLGDFNGDGYQDVLWQNNSTDQVTVHYFDGTQGVTFIGWNWLNNVGEPNGWVLVGAADFDGNGVPDLVWEYMPTGQVTVNYYGGLGGATLLGWNWLNKTGNPGWTVVAVADMNGDGVPDLIWEKNATNQVTVNYYGGTGGATLTSWNWLNSGGEPAGWHVVAAADFDGNGTPDLVWQYAPTRQVTVHYYGGTGGATYQGWNWLNSTGDPGWTVVGANDFNGDGVPDLVWQNDTTGQVTVNYYGGTQGATLIGWNWLANPGYPGWTAVVPR